MYVGELVMTNPSVSCNFDFSIRILFCIPGYTFFSFSALHIIHNKCLQGLSHFVSVPRNVSVCLGIIFVSCHKVRFRTLRPHVRSLFLRLMRFPDFARNGPSSSHIVSNVIASMIEAFVIHSPIIWEPYLLHTTSFHRGKLSHTYMTYIDYIHLRHTASQYCQPNIMAIVLIIRTILKIDIHCNRAE